MISQHSQSPTISELYLRRIDKQYYIYQLGRNGEPQTQGAIAVKVSHKDFEAASQVLQLDKWGKVGLGRLENVEKVAAMTREGQSAETWMISSNHIDNWTQSEEIHIVEGEKVEIPVNLAGDSLVL